MLHFGSGETMLFSGPGTDLQANLQGLHMVDLQANLQGSNMMDLQENLQHNWPQIHSIEASNTEIHSY